MKGYSLYVRNTHFFPKEGPFHYGNRALIEKGQTK